ncbi:hypothetical protein Pla108_15330 [Botrimarina colliarenosi]|uniref:DUF1559 domain-containing protein n=1 Tax=Botrimarina colliarenosi TaxID=2528001 RepID=A0A5C6AME7_9BACT|nr:DUF1559 domain-containing protein [Botrimarina colliarenosi]TWU00581.1 hypothetical protein Pla108_15330 [Botrimarina colliarenosi]
MRRERCGFTLVELLVVIAIIGVLVSLLLPAIQSARESGRRTACMNNMRQLGLGVISYEGLFGRFPGLFDELDTTRLSENSGELYMTWAVEMMPFCERQKLYDRYAEGLTPDKYVELMTCPSDDGKHGAPAENSYVANGGRLGSVEVQKTANGPFLNRAATPSLAMREGHWVDGREYTLAFSENTDALRFDVAAWSGFGKSGGIDPEKYPIHRKYFPDDRTWSPVFFWVDSEPVEQQIINGATEECRTPKCFCDFASRLRLSSDCDTDHEWERSRSWRARPKSRHPNGVNIVFGGGRASFVSEAIDYKLWRALMTPSDEQSDSPYRDILLDDNDLP